MSQTSLSVWFVCRLCRGSFGQVDAFIEHKKQKHFTQFQNTTCIVFEERELGEMYPVIIKAENELVDENIELPIKVEVNNLDIITPFSSELIEEPNLDLAEPKSELITYESKIIPDNEINFLGSKQPEQNPYVILKRLTSEEIQSACLPQRHSRLLKYEQNDFVSNLDTANLSADVDSNNSDLIKAEKVTENNPSATIRDISTEDDLQFECKLCSKQFESDAQLKIHVGICALYHEDRHRFCVLCNRKFCEAKILKRHRLRFHGTEEEKSSVYKFKCHLCRKQYQRAIGLIFHLETHKEKEQVEASNSKLPKCFHPNCGKRFRYNSDLQRHIATHSDRRPFSCSFPNCKKKFKQRTHLNIHFRTHTGERPYKCTVDNCNRAFTKSYDRSIHYRTVHSL